MEAKTAPQLPEIPRNTFPVGLETYRTGKLFASQDWVTPKQKTRAIQLIDEYCGGETKCPNVYFFTRNGILNYLVGDGHHRIAEVINRDQTISCEPDAFLGELDKETMINPEKAAIKFAKYGISGIWPFSEFLEKYNRV